MFELHLKQLEASGFSKSTLYIPLPHYDPAVLELSVGCLSSYPVVSSLKARAETACSWFPMLNKVPGLKSPLSVAVE